MTCLQHHEVQAIRSVMTAYVKALDFGDWPVLRSLFIDNAQFAASNMGRYGSADALLNAFQQRTPRTPIRRHAIFSPSVSIDGEEAVFTSYLINVRFRPGSPGGDYYFGTGFYRNRLIKTAQGWKIAELLWEAMLLEGNVRMIPEAGPPVYLQVMHSKASAPWKSLRNTSSSDSSDYDAIADLLTSFTRAADAVDAREVIGGLTNEASIIWFGREFRGGAEHVGAEFVASVQGASHASFLSNLLVNVSGDEASFSVYAYINAHDGSHKGALMTGFAKRLDSGWRIATLTSNLWWDRARATTLLASSSVAIPSSLPIDSADDRTDVAALLTLFVRQFDLASWNNVADLFIESADGSVGEDYEDYGLGRDAAIARFVERRSKLVISQTFLANFEVHTSADGQSADLHCYTLSRQASSEDPSVQLTSGHFFVNARRQDNQWRFAVIRHRTVHAPRN